MLSTLVRKEAARLLLDKQDYGSMTFCGLQHTPAWMQRHAVCAQKRTLYISVPVSLERRAGTLSPLSAELGYCLP
jgi:hypothetical protein